MVFKLIKECKEHINGPKVVAKKTLENSKDFKPDFKMDKNNINGIEGYDLKEFASFQVRILGYLKYGFLYPLARIGEKIAGKHLFKKSPEGPAFRNFQAYDRAVDKALIEWYDHYNQDVTWKHPLKRLKSFFVSTGFTVIKLLHRIEITLFLSDSAYFEYQNMKLINIYVEMAKLHGDQPVHIMYKDKMRINDPVYFAAVSEGNYASLKERIKTLKPYFDKDGNLKVKYLGCSKSYALKQLANELNCVPKYDVMLNQVRVLKQELFVRDQMLNHINKVTVEGLKPKNEPSKASN